jgi:hypothetical protein
MRVGPRHPDHAENPTGTHNEAISERYTGRGTSDATTIGRANGHVVEPPRADNG